MLADERYNGLYNERVDTLGERVARLWSLLRVRLLARVDTTALVAATQAFVVSRVLIVTVTYLAMALHPDVWGRSHPASPTFWDAWYQWDARWYVRVARSGYHWQDLHHWSSVAFFPFYPILILATVTVIPVSTKLVAIMIANVMFFAALYALHVLVQREFDNKVAGRTLVYLSLFPTALFFFAGYSESPFLLFSVLSVSSMRVRRWGWAGIWGCLAAATRSQGMILVVPFAYECWRAYGWRWRELLRGAWIALIPLSWLPLAIYMQVTFGRPLLFVENQRAWHRVTTWPWDGIWLTLQRIPLNHIASPDPAHNAIELASVTGFALLIAIGWRILPRAFSFYALLSLLLILFTPASLDNYYLPMMSTSRLCLALFPCFITLALYGERWPMLDRLITTLGPALLAVFTVIFLQGAWVA